MRVELRHRASVFTGWVNKAKKYLAGTITRLEKTRFLMLNALLLEDELLKVFVKISIPVVLMAAAVSVPAAQLSTDARTAIPHEVQQLVVIDYRVMQNSSSAMDLRERVMPPELKQLDEALRKSALNDNHDIDQMVDQLAFALFRPQGGSKDSELLETVGIAQGQFPMQDILSNFRKQHMKAKLVRGNRVYPLAKSGMVVCFVDPSTMVFGSTTSVSRALDARDGVAPSLLTNGSMMDAMKTVDSDPLWSIGDPLFSLRYARWKART